MRWRRLAAFASIASSACTLLVDTGDLAGGPQKSADSGPSPRDASSDLDADAGQTAPPVRTDAGDSYAANVLADGPAGYWRLDEPAGASAAADLAGARTGTYVGVTLGAPGPFPGHGAAQFSGHGAYVALEGAFDVDQAKSFSIEAWAIPDDLAGCRHIFTNQQRDNPKRGIALLEYAQNDGGNPAGVFLERYVSDENKNSRAGAPVILATDAFTHIVGVYDGKNLRLYFNGQIVQAGAMDIRTLLELPADPFIGAASETDCSWKGRIAEVAFYEKALGDERIAAHYAARLK